MTTVFDVRAQCGVGKLKDIDRDVLGVEHRNSERANRIPYGNPLDRRRHQHGLIRGLMEKVGQIEDDLLEMVQGMALRDQRCPTPRVPDGRAETIAAFLVIRRRQIGGQQPFGRDQPGQRPRRIGAAAEPQEIYLVARLVVS